jgi:hypothetical protein
MNISSTVTTTTTTTATASKSTSFRSTVGGDSRQAISLVQQLLRRTVRSFYDDECVLIVDTILNEHKW